MKTQSLLKKFNAALLWNGIFYTLYKVASIFFTFSLFQYASQETFSVWASTNSLIFIIILLLDCGFRKSIPRYSATFMNNRSSYKKFIQTIIIFECLLLVVCGFPLLLFVTSFFMNQTTFTLLKPYIITVFFVEGFIALLRLLFHAHFWQKEFNMLHTFTFLIETFYNLYILFMIPQTTSFVATFLANKIVSCCVVITGSFIMLPYLYKSIPLNISKKVEAQKEPFNYIKTFNAFIKHSFFMWASTLIKSVTERNFLFPYITFTIGLPIANHFKVIHDAGLFFQRMALKTIGVSDTALLAHAQESSQLQIMFYDLIKKIFYICVPLLVVGIITAHQSTLIYQNYTTYSLFLIVIIGYLIEIILSPFERFLETKKEYKKLWTSYLPYLIGISFLFLYNWLYSPLSLIGFILFIHLFRLIGSFLMALQVKVIIINLLHKD